MHMNKLTGRVSLCCRDHIYGVLGPIYRTREQTPHILKGTSLNELSGGRDKSGPYHIS